MLEVKYRKAVDLIPYINNSRTHSEEQINQVAASIKEFGFTNPILLDDSGGIIAGHGRLLAAKKLSLSEVPTITLSNLSEAQKKAYVIADNKLALNAGWDDEMLKLEITQLDEMEFDLKLIGFDSDELAILLDNVNFDPATEDEQGQLDELEPKYIDCPHCGKEFDMRGKS
jgi:ParB-like chromosome segregation protein Spo0J